MAVYGTLSEFNLVVGSENRASWDEYCERLKQYFLANDIDPTNGGTQARRRAIFLSSVGADTYSLIRTLCLPDTPEAKTIDQIQELVKNHISPTPIVIAERFRFYNRSQLSSESASEFLRELCRLAGTCDFGEFREQALRDMFTIKLKDKSAQEKLLGEENLTLEKAFQVAQAHERARFSVEEMSTEVHKMNVVESHEQKSKIESRGKQKHQGYKAGSKARPCFICGDCSHWKADCPENKHKKKHRYKKSNVKAVNNKVSDSSSDSEGFSQHAVRMNQVLTKKDQHKVDVVRKVPEIMVKVLINGTRVKMELDTGASVTLMSKSQFDSSELASQTKLKKSDMVLTTITGQKLNVVGQTSVEVRYKAQSVADLTLYVVESEGPPLLGRDWLQHIQLDWSEIKTINNPSVTNECVKNILTKYGTLFDGKLGLVKDLEATLRLKEAAVPKFCKPRAVPFAVKEDIAQELGKLIASGVLKKVDYADWAAPIVAVKKPNGQYRICGDYSVTINKYLMIPEHPMPRVGELLSKLNGGQTFSKLDLSQAYQQIALDENSQKLVTINTHLGLYTYTRVPYGISAAPSLFQSVMDKVLQGIDCGCYLDDIVITGRDHQEHMNNLYAVLDRLIQYGFKLQKAKCEFFQPSVKYLGLLVDKEGTRIDTDGTRAVREAPIPRNRDELRSFLGLVNHYRKFIDNMSTICRPLNQLLEKNRHWEWSEECEQAFKHVKDSLLKDDNLLAHYDPKAKLSLAVDASPVGLGAVISQVTGSGERPIEFASRSLTQAEKNYSQIDREALAIIFGVRKFHQYLYGREFTLCTDNQPLSHIMARKKGLPSLAAARVQRWAIELAAYTFTVCHRPGKQNGNADALSRLPLRAQTGDKRVDKLSNEAMLVNTLAIEQIPVSAKQIARATRNDELLARVLHFTQTGWPEKVDVSLSTFHAKRLEISLEQDVLLWGTRVIIPKKFQTNMMDLLHENHPGIVKMKSLARLHCWWPGLDGDIEWKVRGCETCQSVQSSPPKTVNNWVWPNMPWKRVHIDFAQLTADEYYLILVDSHSKWPEVIEMKTGTTAKATIEALREIFGRMGLPAELCSDNGPPFRSCEFTRFLSGNSIKHILSPPYHPASNGAAERFVRTFKKAMKVKAERESKHHRLQEFLLYYRTTPHSGTEKTPSEMVMGRRLRTKLDLVKPNLGEAILKRNPGVIEPRDLQVGQRVRVRDYRKQGTKWVKGVIVNKLSPVTYEVQVLLDGKYVVWKRHIDQVIVSEEDVSLSSENIRSSDNSLSLCRDVAGTNLLEPTINTEQVNTDQESTPGVRAPVSPRPCVAVEEAVDVGPLRRSSRERRLPRHLATDYEL